MNLSFDLSKLEKGQTQTWSKDKRTKIRVEINIDNRN